METKESPPSIGPSPSSTDMNAKLSTAVYDWIKKNIASNIVPVSMNFGQVGTAFTYTHMILVREAYPAINLDKALGPLFVSMSEMLKSFQETQDPGTPVVYTEAEILSIEQSFEATFLGDVDKELKAYLVHCWEIYQNNSNLA